MILDIKPTADGYALTLRKRGGETVSLTIPREVLYDRPKLQRLAMAHGVRLRLKKYDAASWRLYLANRFHVE